MASGRCGLTSASERGARSGTRWWSVTMTSMPAALATSTSSGLVVPQSTVTMSGRPSATAPRRRGRQAVALVEAARDVRLDVDAERAQRPVMIASPVRPSASKSPKTRTPSPAARARRIRSTTRSASGSSPGSWRPAERTEERVEVGRARDATSRAAARPSGRTGRGRARRRAAPRRAGTGPGRASGSGVRPCATSCRTGFTADLLSDDTGRASPSAGAVRLVRPPRGGPAWTRRRAPGGASRRVLPRPRGAGSRRRSTSRCPR